MRIAVLYDEKNVLVEFKEEKFLQLLKEYFEKTGSLDEAMKQITKDLKKEVLKK